MSSLFYDEYHRNNKNDFFYAHITENNFTYFLIIRAIKKVEKLAQRRFREVLDLGCGVGTMAFFLAHRGYHVVGVDISTKAIQIAEHFKATKKISTVIFREGSVDTISLKKKFDLVLCSEVIEHVADDEALLKNIYAHLKKDGYLVLTTPAQSAPLYRLGLLNKFDHEVGHLRRYTQAILTTKLTQHGFEIIELYGTESIMRNALFTLPVIGEVIRVLKGPLVPLFHWVDFGLVWLFGASNLYVIAQRK